MTLVAPSVRASVDGTPTPSAPSLEVRGVAKTYRVRGRLPRSGRRTVEALRGVDLAVPGGTIHGVIGPNGSGKTTLLRVVSTLIVPDAGTVSIGDVDVVRRPMEARRLLGLSTGEERSLYWRLSGRQNLEFFSELHGMRGAGAEIDAVLRRLGLEEAADRPVMTYSQGMSRRLSLARALLHRPALLLLDEPTRSLDPLSREDLHALVAGLRREGGTTVLLTTHDLDEAVTLCDSVSILRSGEIVDRVEGVADARSLVTRLREAAGEGNDGR